MSVKKVVVLGSTGSIGINTLNVIERFSDKFKVVGLTAYNNLSLFENQIKKFSPKYVAVKHARINNLKRRISTRKTKVFDADTEISRIVTAKEVDIVVIGIRGSAALQPFLDAIRCGKTIAPANKEALVVAGHLIMREAKRHNSVIVPVDSEQSAIFQCLDGRKRNELKKVYLTASGGPLHKVFKKRFDEMTVSQILKHPRWKMGKKITVDSATLMNKGLEVIEAQWLFGLNVKNIEVVIHPEAVIHSMVEFIDGSILAQLGITDMRLPIQYALTYPQRYETRLRQIDFSKLRQLTFDKPDFDKFPALALCFYVARKGGTLPCVLNAANEQAVEAFLKHRLKFLDIYNIVERVVTRHKNVQKPKLRDIYEADIWARQHACKLIGEK